MPSTSATLRCAVCLLVAVLCLMHFCQILDLCLWVGVDADVKVLAPVVKSGNTNNSVVKAAVDVAAKADVGAKAAVDVAAGLKAKVGTVLDANVNAVLGAKVSSLTRPQQVEANNSASADPLISELFR